MDVARQIGTGTSIEKFTKLILIRENVQATITITVFTRISAALTNNSGRIFCHGKQSLFEEAYALMNLLDSALKKSSKLKTT